MGKLNLAICSSASFYTEVIAFSNELEELGINAILPKTAAKIKAEGRENDEAKTDWSKVAVGYHGKAELIREHFNEISGSDAILVTNYEKHGKPNYIGPNVLMEMAVAFYLRKPIYILNGRPDDSPLIDEILGLEPIFLNGDTKLIKF
tara:strand:- start:1311 stop:1754 length:444 start_codon:yes stop_codon:yes gene_type:complete